MTHYKNPWSLTVKAEKYDDDPEHREIVITSPDDSEINPNVPGDEVVASRLWAAGVAARALVACVDDFKDLITHCEIPCTDCLDPLRSRHLEDVVAPLQAGSVALFGTVPRRKAQEIVKKLRTTIATIEANDTQGTGPGPVASQPMELDLTGFTRTDAGR